MKQIELFLFILQVVFLGSCSGQNAPAVPVGSPDALASDPQIADYVVEIFEDSKGNLWFGTVEQGVARFDGKTLTYLTIDDGLPGNTVADIVEDEAGNLWFGTHSGLSKYNGMFFTNFTEKEGLCNDRVSNLLLDKTGMLWVGTWDGAELVLWQDGVVVGSVANALYEVDTQGVFLGCDDEGPGIGIARFFSGELDEVRLWDRVLDDAQIGLLAGG